MRNKKTRVIKVERVDDIPVLWHHLSRMQGAPLLNQHFRTHGHWEGELSFGEVVADWLIFIVSEGDHCLSHMEPWAKEHLETLSGCAGKRVRPLDFSDDRLADILDALSDTEVWNELETSLNGHLLRVYALDGDRVRIDSTTAKTYAGVNPNGLFQFGHSKDHRPDLPQVKINLSVLDPLGMPLTTTVVGGPCADDPLYVPGIQRVQQTLGAGGKTYIGDCKMGALATRGSVAASRDYYLCPLAGAQLPVAEMDALLALVLRGEQKLTPVYDPDTVGKKKPVVVAEGYAVRVSQTAAVDGQTVTWAERRLVIRSLAHAQHQAARLDKRLQQAGVAIEQRNVRKQGKKRLSADQLPTAAQAILERRGVEELVRINVKTTTTKWDESSPADADDRRAGLSRAVCDRTRVWTVQGPIGQSRGGAQGTLCRQSAAGDRAADGGSDLARLSRPQSGGRRSRWPGDPAVVAAEPAAEASAAAAQYVGQCLLATDEAFSKTRPDLSEP